MKKTISEQKFAWMIILPAIIIVFGVVIYPLIRTFIISFQEMNLSAGEAGSFAGLSNYAEVLSSAQFWASAGRTAYFSLVSIAIELVLGTMIALLIKEKLKGTGLLIAVVIIPWAVPNVVSSTIWEWIYHPEYGALNALLTQLHIIDQYQSWLGSPWLALNMAILADAWKMTPLVVIFMLAALQLTNQSVFEAAYVDGAGLFRRFFHITLPYLVPMILVVVVIRTMETFKVFDLIYILTDGGPSNGTMVLSYQAYSEVFENLNYSSGATYSFLIALFIVTLTFIYVQALNRKKV